MQYSLNVHTLPQFSQDYGHGSVTDLLQAFPLTQQPDAPPHSQRRAQDSSVSLLLLQLDTELASHVITNVFDQCTRYEDRVLQLSQCQWLILLPNTRIHETQIIAERLRYALLSELHDHNTLYIGAACAQPQTPFAQLQQAAEEALDYASQHGHAVITYNYSGALLVQPLSH